MNRSRTARPIRFAALSGLLSAATAANAFDDARHGFFVGLGLGVGLSAAETRRDDAPGRTFDDNRIGIDFLIGYAPHERVMLQLGSKGAAVDLDGADATLLVAGFGARVYPLPSSPSIYLTGLYGEGSLSSDDSEDADRDEDFSPTGSAAVVGIGMELYPHLYFEATHMRATLTAPLDRSLTFDVAQSLFTLGWVWY